MRYRWQICLILLFITAWTFIAGCSQEMPPVGGTLVSGEGVVMYQVPEGGFYGIVADSGEKYYPLDLPHGFGIDGLPVIFTLEKRPGTTATVMWGTPVSVISIRSRITTPALAGGHGTITRIELEGGFYGIISPGGGTTSARYYPLNLEDQFRVDHMHVQFSGIEQPDAITTAMWGIPLEVTAMEEIEP